MSSTESPPEVPAAGPAAAAFTVRDLSGVDDLRECEQIQREVWGFIDLDVVPAGLLSIMECYGALAVGAFVGGRMAGFVNGFPGFDGGARLHHSHMLAVRPEFRGAGIGIALKWAQADRVLAQGLDRINWTFDPLQAANANLNLNHLGCVARVYRLNVYGKSQSPLHGGLPTDRLEPEWELRSERVAAARAGRPAAAPGIPDLPSLNRVSRHPSGLPESSAPAPVGERPEVLFRIPPRFTALLGEDPALALDWRLKSRAAFTDALGSGYEVVGFHRHGDDCAYRFRAPTAADPHPHPAESGP